jgi:hypothetical protein
MAVGEGGKGGARGWVIQGSGDVVEASQDEIVGGGEGHGDLGREPRDGVGDAFGARVPQPNAVAAVGIKGWASVPTIQRMRRPGGAVGGFVMDEDANARWCDRSPIEIIAAMELGIGRELGVDAGAAEVESC